MDASRKPGESPSGDFQIDSQQKAKAKDSKRNIYVKTRKHGQVELKKESAMDKVIAKIQFKKPQYASVKDADDILKSYSEGVKYNKKVVDVALSLILKSFQENPENQEIGLDNLKMYSPELLQEMANRNHDHSLERLLMSATLLKDIESNIDSKDFSENKALAMLKKLSDENPSSVTLIDLRDKFQNSTNKSDKVLNELEYEVFKAQLQELEPGSDEFKNLFFGKEPDQLRELFPRYVKEVFIAKKQYKGQDGDDFYSKLNKQESKLGALQRSDKDYRIYRESITTLAEIFPGIDKYLDTQSLVFTLNAMDQVLAGLRTKDPFDHVPCEACRVNELAKKLEKIDFSQDQQLEFVVNYSSYPNHMAPVHVRVKDNEMIVIVTESLQSISKLEKEFKHMLDDLQSTNKVSVLFCGTDRQKDETNCPTFSVADMKEFARHPELFDEIEEQFKSKTSNNADAKIFGSINYSNRLDLTTRVMRYSQSVTKLMAKKEDIEKKLVDLKTKIQGANLSEEQGVNTKELEAEKAKLEADLKLIESTLKKHVKTGVIKCKTEEEKKNFNVFAMQRYCKHEALFISAMLESSLKAA